MNNENLNNILISGISGFVGGNLKQYLQNAYEVIGVSRKESIDNDIISYGKLDKSSFDKSTSFIHLAGKAHDLKKNSGDKEYYEANTELTKKLFNQFLESDCKVFIYMSSVKATADVVDGVLDENHISKPVTAYGKSKLAAEEYILSKQVTNKKRVYILRPCMIHGPNNKGNLNLLYNFVEKGIPYPFGKYENQRSFLSVENLCFLIRELIENDQIPGGVYNVADDKTLSTKDLVEIIGQTIGKKVSVLNIPKFIISLLAKIGDYLPIPINSERLQKLTENYVVSNKKIKKVMQKEFPLTGKKGIELTVKSFNT
ncbi:UDP-glucose 4-epimerase [Tenacibaculum sp. 190524A02b]|uniref:NAD-dependent epimerase/dehydratase family protein n=1 Tax=Tenacibaculum vairaonense TaxID=3137860 RepID=UPI0032B20097